MKYKIYLAQTDTTVGFLSKDFKALNSIKKRQLNTPCIKSVASLQELKNHARVPKVHKNLVRRAKKTTFIYPNNQSIRVIKTSPHKEFILDHKWLYTTSANETGKNFDEKYAKKVVDEIIENKNGFFETKASTMFKISKFKLQKIRS